MGVKRNAAPTSTRARPAAPKPVARAAPKPAPAPVRKAAAPKAGSTPGFKMAEGKNVTRVAKGPKPRLLPQDLD